MRNTIDRGLPRGEVGNFVGLRVRDDALLHLFWRQAIVRPHDAHGGNVDVRENVDGQVTIADTARMALTTAITTKVYGRRSASRTIHIGSFSVD
jgi:hypothetical protein